MAKINIDKINDPSLTRIGQQNSVKKPTTETPIVESKSTVSEDKVELSQRASEVTRLVDEIKALPDLREEKVSSLREQIASGNYNPSNEDIADAILKDEK